MKLEYLEPKDFDRLSSSITDAFEEESKLKDIIEKWDLNHRMFWSREKTMNGTITCYIRLIIDIDIVSDPIWIDQFDSKEELKNNQNRY